MVSTTDCDELLPTCTDPKETLDGAAVIGLLPTAKPWSPTLKFELKGLVVRVSSPPTQPVEPGANVTFTATLFPAASVAGNASPDWLNPLPLTFNAVIVTLVCPLFVTVTVWVADWDTTTEPNFRLVGEHRSCCDDRACDGRHAKATRRKMLQVTRAEKDLTWDWGSRIRAFCRVPVGLQRYR